MTRTYLDRQPEIDAASDPLLATADLAQADNVKRVLTKSSALPSPNPESPGQAALGQARISKHDIH